LVPSNGTMVIRGNENFGAIVFEVVVMVVLVVGGGLFEARGLMVVLELLYPSHFRPVLVHFKQAGLTSSHFIRRILPLSTNWRIR
jgi:hypothetical protein